MQLFDFYEIVVFTSESAMSGNSLLTALDPNQLVLYKLYRDSTTYIDGHHVKVGCQLGMFIQPYQGLTSCFNCQFDFASSMLLTIMPCKHMMCRT